MRQEPFLYNEEFQRRKKSNWIEMQPHYTQTPQYSYQNFQQERYYQIDNQKEPNPANITYQQLLKKKDAKMEEPFKYPDYIHLNGIFYKSDKIPDLAKPPSKIPSVTASCYHCNQRQMIPGTANKFQCGICHSNNFCKPAFSIFQCGVCKGKVLYPIIGTQTIKCTRCGTINRLAVQEQKYTEVLQERGQEKHSNISYNQLVENNQVTYPRLQW